ncbi:arylsulfotransferase family protein [Cerasicoccus frondis]|uniref:arylsulfotransferase family protein n=1 Tax=Cerasicoccus frondis TaxID=490090 RepID=UPI0028529E27|nr:arylsulfotransferase family protein [Cerasicoccus frondis]
MKLVQWLAICFLIGLIAFLTGIVIMETKSWPYSVVQEITTWADGHAEEESSILEKVVNDLDIEPARLITEVDWAPYENLDFKEVTIPNRRSRAEKPLVYVSPNAPKGYRIIHGSFDFENGLHGAILLDAEGNCIHQWTINLKELDHRSISADSTFPHGFAILPDGSIITAFDSLYHGILRLDKDSNIVWANPGNYHHTISPDDEGGLWTFKVYDLVRLSADTGEVLEQIEYRKEMLPANMSDTDLFGVPTVDSPRGSAMPQGDPLHPNDVEPLPPELAEAFPMFQAGDLLVSYRDLNLVCVFDRETHEIKWWRVGFARRQHDPDWQPDGLISVFDNNMHRGPARIVTIDPETYDVETLVDGEEIQFKSWHRGKHQITEAGNVLVTSSVQGRVFEITPDGEIVFEFLNRYEDNRMLSVSEAIWLPSDYFDAGVFPPAAPETAE